MKIEINDLLIKKLKEFVDNSDEFSSVEELIEKVLKEAVEDSGEELVEEKLKSLGYLN